MDHTHLDIIMGHIHHHPVVKFCWREAEGPRKRAESISALDTHTHTHTQVSMAMSLPIPAIIIQNQLQRGETRSAASTLSHSHHHPMPHAHMQSLWAHDLGLSIPCDIMMMMMMGREQHDLLIDQLSHTCTHRVIMRGWREAHLPGALWGRKD